MDRYFCDNKKCKFHYEVDDNTYKNGVLFTPDGQIVRITTHINQPPAVYSLCEICHEALATVGLARSM